MKNLALGPQLVELAAVVAMNATAVTTLRETLPRKSKIKATCVHPPSSKMDFALPLKGATISVLAPENDIDFFYLGKAGDPSRRRAWD